MSAPVASSVAAGTRRVPGEPGYWLLIFGEMTMFVIYLGLYLHSRAHNLDLFRAGQESLSQGFGAINTVVLLTSSLFVYAGLAATRRGDRVVAPRLFGIAVGLAGFFCAIKVFEWSEKLTEGTVPSTNEFYAYYFVITGVHLLHVLVGMGVLVALLSQSRRQHISPGRMQAIDGGAVWWHMVDFNWMLIFPLLYLIR